MIRSRSEIAQVVGEERHRLLRGLGIRLESGTVVKDANSVNGLRAMERGVNTLTAKPI